MHRRAARLKIGLIILHADARRGGAEKYTVDLARSLAHRGHDVTILASSFHEAPWEAKQIRCEATALTRTWGYRRFLSQLETHLTAHSFDVLHAMLPVRTCDVYHPHAGLAIEAIRTGHLQHRGRFRLARWGNHVNLKRRTFAAVERDALFSHTPPMVLCLSDYVRRSVRDRYPLNESLLPVLFNAVDLRHFEPKRVPDAGNDMRAEFGLGHDTVVALMIAQDFHRKGLDTAVRAVARCTDPRVRLLVVGRDMPGPYKSLATRLGAEKRVVFAGPTSDPYRFYRGADLFILPTRHDPCSLVVLEALAMGLPVITTALNGAAEIMTDNLDGMILPDPNDVLRLTDALKVVLEDRTRARMAQATLTLRPRLSYDQHVTRLVEIYQRAIDRKRRPATAVRT
jgi:UDP-glucose:(heptosyl)LPS alpha-1,3-glucosyltransferase